MITTNTFSLFQITERAKTLGLYTVANLAFVVLLDAALDNEKELHFIWEKAPGNDDDDIYYDLLVISDGLRTSCIPAPLLKKPEVLRSLCKEEIQKHDHYRMVDPEILEVNLQEESERLISQILKLNPKPQVLANKYLVQKECQICLFFAEDRAVHCSVHPCGYPYSQGICSDWEINLEDKQIEEKLRIAQRTVVARVERTGWKRYIYMPEKGMTFSEIPWGSHDWTLSKHDDGTYSPVESKGDPQWIWYFVNRQLPTLKTGESRWLIGKGCDNSSYYEVWVIQDPEAKVKPLKPDVCPPPDSLWRPLVLTTWVDPDPRFYECTYAPGKEAAVAFKDISQTCEIIQHLPSSHLDPFYSNRWLVWNKKGHKFDVLCPAIR